MDQSQVVIHPITCQVCAGEGLGAGDQSPQKSGFSVTTLHCLPGAEVDVGLAVRKALCFRSRAEMGSTWHPPGVCLCVCAYVCVCMHM